MLGNALRVFTAYNCICSCCPLWAASCVASMTCSVALLLMVVALVAGALSQAAAAAAAAAPRPHLVFVLCDDLGFNDIGFHDP
eukprot:COSAG03_NODE_11957_length_568_cov_2.223881_1_plen_82_part_10